MFGLQLVFLAHFGKQPYFLLAKMRMYIIDISSRFIWPCGYNQVNGINIIVGLCGISVSSKATANAISFADAIIVLLSDKLAYSEWYSQNKIYFTLMSTILHCINNQLHLAF